MVVKNIRKIIGGLFTILGYICWIIFGLWGLFISFAIVEIVFSTQTAFFSLLVLPIMYIIAPLYALLAWGSWFPLFVGWGGVLVSTVFMQIGDWIKEGNQRNSDEFQFRGYPLPPNDPLESMHISDWKISDRSVDSISIQIYGKRFEQLTSDQKKEVNKLSMEKY